MSDVTIQFFGATDTVTGSRFLVSNSTHKVLIDCGLFQGVIKIEKKNFEKLPVAPSEIDFVLLSHGHLDHSGFLPALIRDGFDGTVFATHYTRAIADVILRDSAHLQAMDAKWAAKREGREEIAADVLYDDKDVEKTLDKLTEVPYKKSIELTPDIHATFYRSGHILGSAFLVLENSGKKLLFTSDMGRGSHPFLFGPDPAPDLEFDAIISESTYGDRLHETPVSDFAAEINAAYHRGGSLLIPAFAVDRTEEILFELRRLITAGLIPKLPVYIDSPMAQRVLNFYREAFSNGGEDIRSEVAERFKNTDPFDPGTLHELFSAEESKSLNEVTEQCIIISASGMATGGRVVFHLEQMLPDPRNTVILVGYQARGSRGLALQQGVEKIRIHGKYVPVEATIVSVEAFSVHADADELVAWFKNVKRPKMTYLVHGEFEAQSALSDRLHTELEWPNQIPVQGKSYTL